MKDDQKQPDLFHQPPVGAASARATDPATSHLAARRAEASGAAGCARERIEYYVGQRPGLTAAEIAEALQMERHVPSRRLPELRELGLVHNGEARKCRATGSLSMTWWPGVPRI